MKKVSRYLLRTFLIITFLVAIILALLNKKDFISPVLLILSTIISIYTAQQIIEKEEDEKVPYIELKLNFEKRYGLVLFELINTGGSSAYNINIEWKEPPLKINKTEVLFSSTEDKYLIPHLRKEECLYFIWDASHKLSELSPNILEGQIEFSSTRKSSAKKEKLPFYISLDSYKRNPYYTDEMIKTQYELQQIPKKLNELSEIKTILKSLKKSNLTISELEDLEEQEKLLSRWKELENR